MKLNRNMTAVSANNQLLRTEKNLAASMERLSSGLKFTSAKDNPAGMAISNKMKSQIDALDKAKNNVVDGVSAVQIADGALNEVNVILQRMRELAVQASNGTNSIEDRRAVQLEIESLRKEVNRISTDTEYNKKNLLNGSLDQRVYGEDVSRISISDTVMLGNYSLEVESLGTVAEAALTIPQGVDGTITLNGLAVPFTKDTSEEEFYASFLDTAQQVGYDVGREGDQIYLRSRLKGENQEIHMTASAQVAAAMGIADMENVEVDPESGDVHGYANGTDASVRVPDDYEDAGFSETTAVSTNGDRVIVTDRNGFSLDFLLDEDFEPGTLELEVTEIGPMTIQLGSNQYQTMEVRIPEISSETLYLDHINVCSELGADYAIGLVDEAIEKVISVRSGIGAYQNRLEFAESALTEERDDVTMAYSALADTDMAQEMTEYTQLSVLDQAAISVLSQANDIPQQILSLLS